LHADASLLSTFALPTYYLWTKLTHSNIFLLLDELKVWSKQMFLHSFPSKKVIWTFPLIYAFSNTALSWESRTEKHGVLFYQAIQLTMHGTACPQNPK
jgi:hypothetical protein